MILISRQKLSKICFVLEPVSAGRSVLLRISHAILHRCDQVRSPTTLGFEEEWKRFWDELGDSAESLQQDAGRPQFDVRVSRSVQDIAFLDMDHKSEEIKRAQEKKTAERKKTAAAFLHVSEPEAGQEPAASPIVSSRADLSKDSQPPGEVLKI